MYTSWLSSDSARAAAVFALIQNGLPGADENLLAKGRRLFAEEEGASVLLAPEDSALAVDVPLAQTPEGGSFFVSAPLAPRSPFGEEFSAEGRRLLATAEEAWTQGGGI